VKRRSPPTPAGVPAIEAMLYEGVNVNITLLFAIKDHEAVAQAYIRALERRLAESQPVRHVASVASFFLSRIDVLVDQLLAHRIRPDAPYGEGPRAEHLFGKAAVANARLAYQSFKRTFSGERWRALAERGPVCSGRSVRSVVPAAYAAFDSRRFGRRLFAHDPWLWTADAQQAEAIRQRLGWFDSLEVFRPQVQDLAAFATGIKEAGYAHVVLLGMGGSSLWADVCRETFGSAQGWPELLVLDNTDPVAIRQVESHLDPAQTLFIVSSKSGTTTETLSLYRHFYERVSQHVRGAAGNHFVAITDPGTPLAGEAHTRGFRHCFENPGDIGGRYAALSYVGLVPMALVGLDIAALLDWAQQMRVSCGAFIPAAANPGISLGTLLGVGARRGDRVGHARVDQRAGTPRPCSKTLCVRSHRRITGATPRWCGEEGVSL
jgi:hypothetical protein